MCSHYFVKKSKTSVDSSCKNVNFSHHLDGVTSKVIFQSALAHPHAGGKSCELLSPSETSFYLQHSLIN